MHTQVTADSKSLKRTTATAMRQRLKSKLDKAALSQEAQPLSRRVMVLAFTSAVLIWCAFPPLGWWPLAWIAPIGWLRLVSEPAVGSRRFFGMLYLAGLVHWLLMIAWIRLPHWSAYFGWVALAGYLAIYPAIFVWLARGLVHRRGWSILAAAPIAWTACELLRGNVLTGFAISLLGHSQLPLLPLVQISDLTGAYGVSFLIILFAAGMERMLPLANRSTRRAVPLLICVVTLAGCWIYGVVRIRSLDVQDQAKATQGRESTLRVALIQGALDTQFDGDEQRVRQAFFDYAKLAAHAAAERDDVDLMIWPESMFTGTEPMVTFDPDAVAPAEWDGSDEEFRDRLAAWEASVNSRIRWMAQQTKVPMIAGIAWDHFTRDGVQRYNSAFLADQAGAVVGRYDKMHRVMFGEYVPLGNWFPWLYRLTPMPSGLTPGAAPTTFDVDGFKLAPAICFENTVPHLIRRQVNRLAAEGQDPDVLVTVTNDGWFWGSSLLDVHLTCGIFRAIELRRPHLIAANTGFSAWIDGSGRVRQKGPRRAPAVIYAEVQRDPRTSVYQRTGDLFGGVCCLLCLWGAWGAVRGRGLNPSRLALSPDSVSAE